MYTLSLDQDSFVDRIALIISNRIFANRCTQKNKYNLNYTKEELERRNTLESEIKGEIYSTGGTWMDCYKRIQGSL